MTARSRSRLKLVKPDAMQISLTDAVAIGLLQAEEVRITEHFNAAVGPIRERFMAIIAEIEQRSGLPQGAIGTTHQINLDTSMIDPLIVDAPASESAD